MKRTNLLLIVLLGLMVVGCQRKPIIHKIHVDVTENHKKTITLTDYTDFEWDRALLFNNPRSTMVGHRCDSLEKLFHIDLNKIAPKSPHKIYYDFTYPLLFLKGEEVVHVEINKEDHFPDDRPLFANMECIMFRHRSIGSQDIIEIRRDKCTYKAQVGEDYQFLQTVLLEPLP